MTSVARTAALTKDYQYGFSDPEQYSFKSRRGLDRDVVEQISAHKQEPEWMLHRRVRAVGELIQTSVSVSPRLCRIAEVAPIPNLIKVQRDSWISPTHWPSSPTSVVSTPSVLAQLAAAEELSFACGRWTSFSANPCPRGRLRT